MQIYYYSVQIVWIVNDSQIDVWSSWENDR